MGSFAACAPTASLATGALAAVVAGTRRLGLDTDALLAKVGIADPECAPETARVPYGRVSAFWAAAVKASGDPALGLRVAENLDPAPFSLLTYLGRTGAGFQEVVRDVERYAGLLGDGVSFRLIKRGGRTVLVHRLAGWVRIHPASADYVLAAAVALIRREIAPAFRPAAVEFRHSRPPDIEPYKSYFQAPLRFNAEENALELQDLACLAPHAPDARLHGILERLAEHLLDVHAKEGALIRDLRSEIEAQLACGRPTATALARRFGMSERTLRRRLSESGIELSTLIDDVRYELAERLLDSMPVARVAERLGFSEPSAFHRAYRRWTGTTPRRQLAMGRTAE